MALSPEMGSTIDDTFLLSDYLFFGFDNRAALVGAAAGADMVLLFCLSALGTGGEIRSCDLLVRPSHIPF
jgi:hypothetical protein